MNRRGFLSACLALGAAPAIVRADSLMRIIPRDTGLFYSEYRWVQEGPVIVDLTQGAYSAEVVTFDKIISVTLAANRDRVIAAITTKNALLRKLQEEQLGVILWVGGSAIK